MPEGISHTPKRKNRQARNQQQHTIGRRDFLKAAGVAGAAIATGGIGWSIFDKTRPHGIDSGKSSRVTATPLPTSNPEAALPVSVSEVFTGEVEETRSFLNRYEEQVRSNPNELERILPAVTQLAIAYVSKEMGYEQDLF